MDGTKAGSDYESLLGMKHHYEISRCLLDLDNQQIVQVGLALGMNYAKLKRMRSLPDDMVAAWLRREDEVLEVSGVPTWKSLAEALKDVGQNGLAIKIQQQCTNTGKKHVPPAAAVPDPEPRTQTLNQVSENVSMKNLTLIKWRDSQGEQRKLRIVQSICPKWRTIGNLLEISDSVLESIKSRHHGDLEECCFAVMRQWLDNGSQEYPLTWKGLLGLLDDAECGQVAGELKNALHLLKIYCD